MRMDRPATLSAAFVRTVREPGRYGDGRGGYGLSVLVRPTANGRVSKTWSQRLYINGKPVMLGLGSYPIVPLADARAKALENRQSLEMGGDPRTSRGMPTFKQATEEVLAMLAPTWKPGGRTEHRWRQTLASYAYPLIGDKPINEVTTADVMRVLVPIWNTKSDTARRLRQSIGMTMRWAIAQDLRTDNPAGDALTGALPRKKPRPQHYRALPFTQVPAALVTVRATGAHWATKACFEYMILTAARGGEARLMTWDELDVASATWAIPASRMKTGRAHRVPLSTQALRILADAREHTGGAGLVFPSVRGKELSNATVNKLLRDNDIDAVSHGFRSSFRDWAAECADASSEVSELALAHVNSNRVEAAYRRTDLFERRRQLMRDWADYVTF